MPFRYYVVQIIHQVETYVLGCNDVVIAELIWRRFENANVDPAARYVIRDSTTGTSELPKA